MCAESLYFAFGFQFFVSGRPFPVYVHFCNCEPEPVTVTPWTLGIVTTVTDHGLHRRPHDMAKGTCAWLSSVCQRFCWRFGNHSKQDHWVVHLWGKFMFNLVLPKSSSFLLFYTVSCTAFCLRIWMIKWVFGWKIDGLM